MQRLHIRIHIARIANITNPNVPVTRLQFILPALSQLLIKIHRKPIIHHILPHPQLHQIAQFTLKQLRQLSG